MIKNYEIKEVEQLIIVPDVVVESEGLACGDKLILTVAIVEGCYFFRFFTDCCSVCSGVSKFLMEKLYGQDEQTILRWTSQLLTDNFTAETNWLRYAPKERILCVRTAVKLLETAVTSYNPQCNLSSSAKLLACDACVSSFTIQWNVMNDSPKEQRKGTFEQLQLEAETLDDPLEMELQKLGKCELTEDEVKTLVNMMSNMNQPLFEKIKKLRLPNLYRNNLIKYTDKHIQNEVMTLTKKQIVSQLVTRLEVKKIEQYIHQQQWKISKVKGARTSEFYDENHYRTFLDYDFVAGEIVDGIQFINYLLNQKGFKFVTGGSVPFSLKVVDDYEGVETLTGHLHLEKIIQDQFQIVIDINLGGFPLGRQGVVKLNEQNEISIEEQFIITLCHIFKHEKVYMKDINDIYYMLKNMSLNIEKLYLLVEKNDVQLYFYVLMQYFNKHFSLPKIDLKQYVTTHTQWVVEQFCETWPYSRKSHFWVKFYDNVYRSMKMFSFEQAIDQTVAQSFGTKYHQNEQRTHIFHAIQSYKNERTYLYPAVIFNHLVNLSDLPAHLQLDEIVPNYLVKFSGDLCNLIISSFGLFIIHNQHEVVHERMAITNEIMAVLEALNIKVKDVHPSYVMNARQDLWLY